MSPAAIGRRIVIYGVTGSGKTTLARALANHLDLTRIELDAIRHDGEWDATPWDVMRTRLEIAIASAPNGWVCEGNYNKVRDVALSRADTVIWLRLPWRTSFTRLFRRTVRHVLAATPLYSPAGPRESWRVAFASRDSILWWAIHHHKKTMRSVEQALRDAPPTATRIILRTPAEVAALLEQLYE